MIKLQKNNPNTKEHWKEVYDKNGVGITLIQKYRYEIITYYIEDKPCDVVDLGCGTGICDIFVKSQKPFSRITGVDLNGVGRDLDINGTKIFTNFVEGDCCDTKLPSDSFDYVISMETLEHVDDPQKMIKEAYRLLRMGGKVALITPYLNMLPSGEHVWSFDYKDLKDMFKYAGFRDIWVFPYASGSQGLDDKGNVVTQPGTWDEIFTLAIK